MSASYSPEYINLLIFLTFSFASQSETLFCLLPTIYLCYQKLKRFDLDASFCLFFAASFYLASYSNIYFVLFVFVFFCSAAFVFRGFFMIFIFGFFSSLDSSCAHSRARTQILRIRLQYIFFLFFFWYVSDGSFLSVTIFSLRFLFSRKTF